MEQTYGVGADGPNRIGIVSNGFCAMDFFFVARIWAP